MSRDYDDLGDMMVELVEALGEVLEDGVDLGGSFEGYEEPDGSWY